MQISSATFEAGGFAVVPQTLCDAQCAALPRIGASDYQGAGTRELPRFAWAQQFAGQLRQLPALAPLLAGSQVALRCSYFAKLSSRNCLAPLHQDLWIPLAARAAAAPCKAWSKKQRTWFCQSPLLTLRRLNANRGDRSPSFTVEAPMKCCFFLGLILSAVGAAAEPSGSPVPKEVAAWIQSYASSQASHGVAPTYYPGATKIAQGRLSGEGAAAVVFTLEGAGGGNNYSQYLAVFWKRHGHYVYCCSRRVGGKGIRSVEQLSLRGESIRIAGNNYVPGADPMCCPSKPYTAALAVQNAELVELRAADSWRTGT